MPDHLAGWLQHAAARDGAGTGLRFLDRHEVATFHTWPEVEARAARAAGALHAHGVRPGDRVVIVMPTGLGFFDAFFGCTLAGAVPVPLYPPVRLGRLDTYIARTTAMLQATQAIVVLTEPRIARIFGRILEAARPRLGMLDTASLQQGPPRRQPNGPDDLAMVQFSSGTTVDPKPVALTHRQVLANTSRILDVVLRVTPMDGDPSAHGVSWLPLYHDMGLIGCVFPALLAPGPLTLLPPEAFLAKPALWLRAISRYRGTISPAPNFAYQLCVDRIRDEDLQDVDLSTWRMALNGAEPVSPATLRAFQARFGPHGFDARAMMPVYGLSEVSLAATFTPAWTGARITAFDRQALARRRVVPDPQGTELVSVGAPLPDHDVRIDAGPGPDEQVGRILVRGPSVMRGYLNRDAQPFVDGWLDTGDLGFLHKGELYVTGRAKDVLIVRGQNHAPHELERAADTVPGIRTGCSVAVSDLHDGTESVVVFAEVRTPQEGQADAVMRAVQSATGVAPDLVVLLAPGTIPRTSSGKLRRAATLAAWKDGTLTPPRAVTPWMLAGAMAGSFLGHWRARRGSGS